MTWRLDMEADTGLYTINDDDGEFARVTAVRDDHARARLLVSSAELLEAGKGVLSLLEAVRFQVGFGPSQTKRVEALRAAIAKATGEAGR